MRVISLDDIKLTTAVRRLELWGTRGLRSLRAQPASNWVRMTEIAAVIGLAALSTRLVWTLVGAPEWPAGIANAATSVVQSKPRDWQVSALLTVDPFHRGGAVNPTLKTGRAPETMLNLQLFGIRAGHEVNMGSAIIAGQDNIQNAYFIGQDIMPGVTLESVARGHVTIRRNGVTERLSLDKEKTTELARATVVTGGVTAAPQTPAAESKPRIDAGASAFFAGIKFANQNEENGARGVILQPGTIPELFSQAGLKAGDLLVGVNGMSVTDVTSLMALANTLRGAEHLSLEIVSEGQRKIHQVAVDR